MRLCTVGTGSTPRYTFFKCDVDDVPLAAYDAEVLAQDWGLVKARGTVRAWLVRVIQLSILRAWRPDRRPRERERE